MLRDVAKAVTLCPEDTLLWWIFFWCRFWREEVGEGIIYLHTFTTYHFLSGPRVIGLILHVVLHVFIGFVFYFIFYRMHVLNLMQTAKAMIVCSQGYPFDSWNSIWKCTLLRVKFTIISAENNVWDRMERIAFCCQKQQTEKVKKIIKVKLTMFISLYFIQKLSVSVSDQTVQKKIK